MIVTIHQPEHLPWLGFFDKLRQADLYVALDHVQFRKNYFQNRNRIQGARGPVWLTVPLEKGPLAQRIDEVRIAQGDRRWATRCWKTLQQRCGRAPFFAEHAPFFEAVYGRPWERLVDLNLAVIRYLLDAFGIDVPLRRSSELCARSARGTLVLDLCREVGAQTYLSGISGRDYLDPAAFAAAGIELRFQAFHHPIYPQRGTPFQPCMSAVELLFQYGPESLRALRGEGVETLERLFE